MLGGRCAAHRKRSTKASSIPKGALRQTPAARSLGASHRKGGGPMLVALLCTHKNPRYRISGPGTDVKNGHVLTAHHKIAQKLRARRLALLENRGAAGSHTAIQVARHTACCEGSKRMGARARESGCWRRNRSQESGKWKWRVLG